MSLFSSEASKRTCRRRYYYGCLTPNELPEDKSSSDGAYHHTTEEMSQSTHRGYLIPAELIVGDVNFDARESQWLCNPFKETDVSPRSANMDLGMRAVDRDTIWVT